MLIQLFFLKTLTTLLSTLIIYLLSISSCYAQQPCDSLRFTPKKKRDLRLCPQRQNQFQGNLKSVHAAQYGEFLVMLRLLKLVVDGVGIVQEWVLRSEAKHQELSSIELFGLGSYNITHPTRFLSPIIRANWGILGAEYRNTSFVSRESKLSTHDFQILKLNIPIPHVRLSAGWGIVTSSSRSTVIFESAYDGQVLLFKDKLAIKVEYRFTPKGYYVRNQVFNITSDDREFRFRTEFNTQIDYQIKKLNRIFISPGIGIRKQKYFAIFDDTFAYFMLSTRWK